MDVIVLKRPEALQVGAIQNLLQRALESDALLTPHGFDKIAADIFNYVTDPRGFLLLGFEDGDFKSLVLGYMPVGNLFPYPTVIIFYNEGSLALKRATQRKLADLMLEHGYTKMLGVNHTGKPDKVWVRAIVPEFAKAESVGSLMMIEVT